MELRVAELAEAAGVGVDTVRFYQARGLIPAPLRRGRFAIYSEQHLERLRRVRSLLDSGFSLAQIRQILETDPEQPTARGVERSEQGSLLEALADRSIGDGTLSRPELAAQTGVPEALIASSIEAGLITPVEIHGQQRFPRSDIEMLKSALEILGMGLPLDRLLELGAQHAQHIERLAEQAIDLFDESIRKPRGEDDQSVRRVFERLLPQATQVVALHFQRTIVARALARLRKSGDARALEEALEMTQAARLEVQWR
ncbi:MAG: MerR family transcriptional regulator [Myxococcota bacterium]